MASSSTSVAHMVAMATPVVTIIEVLLWRYLVPNLSSGTRRMIRGDGMLSSAFRSQNTLPDRAAEEPVEDDKVGNDESKHEKGGAALEAEAPFSPPTENRSDQVAQYKKCGQEIQYGRKNDAPRRRPFLNFYISHLHASLFSPTNVIASPDDSANPQGWRTSERFRIRHLAGDCTSAHCRVWPDGHRDVTPTDPDQLGNILHGQTRTDDIRSAQHRRHNDPDYRPAALHSSVGRGCRASGWRPR